MTVVLKIFQESENIEPLRSWPWFLCSTLIVGLDQLTKWWAMHTLTPFTPVPVVPSFNFMLMYNRGAAFSFLHDAGGWQKWFLIGLTLTVCVLLIRFMQQPNVKRWTGIAFAWILGGAIGNLWDRIQLGYVVDFIQLYYEQFYWPAFNIADTAITLGALLLVREVFSNN